MRHARVLGLCLLATVAVATAGTGQALANEFTGPWTVFKDCPINNPEVRELLTQEPFCYIGQTAGGKQGGFFRVGKVTTPLSQPIILQGAMLYNTEQGGYRVFPAEGGETLESPELEVPHGLKLITKAMEEEEGWPKALRQAFNKTKRDGEWHLHVKIELAGGNELYEEPEALNLNYLIEGHGTAFKLPLKVRLINPLLERLDEGVPCTVGSDADPVIQNLTTGQSGALRGSVGLLEFAEEFSIIINKASELVDGTYEVPAVEGCGGAYSSYIDDALNHLLELPGKAEMSATELRGTLYAGVMAEAIKNYEEGWRAEG